MYYISTKDKAGMLPKGLMFVFMTNFALDCSRLILRKNLRSPTTISILSSSVLYQLIKKIYMLDLLSGMSVTQTRYI